jgi:hypothetical protein
MANLKGCKYSEKPNLVEFIKRQYFFISKSYESKDAKTFYVESKVTYYISLAIFIFLFGFTIDFVKSFFDYFFSIRVITWILIVFYFLVLYTVLEVVHWFYAIYKVVQRDGAHAP